MAGSSAHLWATLNVLLLQSRCLYEVVQPYSIKTRHVYLNIGKTTFPKIQVRDLRSLQLRLCEFDPFKFLNCPKVQVRPTFHKKCPKTMSTGVNFRRTNRCEFPSHQYGNFSADRASHSLGHFTRKQHSTGGKNCSRAVFARGTS